MSNVVNAMRRVDAQEERAQDILRAIAVNSILEAMDLVGRRRMNSVDARAQNIVEQALLSVRETENLEVRTKVRSIEVSDTTAAMDAMAKSLEALTETEDGPAQ